MATATSRVDWKKAKSFADVLGIETRRLVASRDVEAARAWALRQARDHSVFDGNELRAGSYLELAVLLGHEPQAEKPAA